MSQPSNVPMSSGEWSNKPAIFRQWLFPQLEGRLLTLVETLGFDEKREQAVKSLIRQEVWKFWDEGQKEDSFLSKFPGLSDAIEKMLEPFWEAQNAKNTQSGQATISTTPIK